MPIRCRQDSNLQAPQGPAVFRTYKRGSSAIQWPRGIARFIVYWYPELACSSRQYCSFTVTSFPSVVLISKDPVARTITRPTNLPSYLYGFGVLCGTSATTMSPVWNPKNPFFLSVHFVAITPHLLRWPRSLVPRPAALAYR